MKKKTRKEDNLFILKINLIIAYLDRFIMAIFDSEVGFVSLILFSTIDYKKKNSNNFYFRKR